MFVDLQEYLLCVPPFNEPHKLFLLVLSPLSLPQTKQQKKQSCNLSRNCCFYILINNQEFDLQQLKMNNLHTLMMNAILFFTSPEHQVSESRFKILVVYILITCFCILKLSQRLRLFEEILLAEVLLPYGITLAPLKLFYILRLCKILLLTMLEECMIP